MKSEVSIVLIMSTSKFHDLSTSYRRTVTDLKVQLLFVSSHKQNPDCKGPGLCVFST